MPRSLPQASDGSNARRRLPLLGEAPRDVGRYRPIYAVWEITLRCDLACHHCGSRAGHARQGELSTDEALDLVAQMAELGVLEVSLIGGEVYLRDDWTTLARAVRDHGMSCTVVTGGRGFTDERARQAFDAGVQSVSVSIDGLEHTHDALRGVRGSHRAAFAALASLQKAGVQISANTQIGARNLHELLELYALLAAAGIHSWQVMLTAALGRAADHPELLCQPYQMLELLPLLVEIKRRATVDGIVLLPGNNIGYFGPHEAALRDHLPQGHRGSCGAGRSTLGIEAHGDIKGCPSLPSADYVGGNLREHRLVDLWERAPALRFTRDRTVEDLWGYCRTCYYADECRAGCSWTAHVLFGRPGNNPYCHHRALELAARGLRERVVPSARATGEPFDHGRFELVVEPWPLPTTSEPGAK